MTEAPLVFVSHSSKDAARAYDLVVELERRGIACWIAPRNISAGTAYDDAIIDALGKCDSLVVLISEASIASRHVRTEVSRAASDGKRIVPIRLVDVEIQGGLKFFLELSQYVDFFPKSGPDVIDSVAAALKNAPAPTLSRTPPVVKPSGGERRWLYVVGAALLVITFGGYSVISKQQAAQEEETLRLQSLADSLQVYPLFELRNRYVVLTNWNLNGGASSNWSGVSAHWLVNGRDVIPFDYAMPRELPLSQAKDFSTLALVLEVPGQESPVSQDYSFDVRKLINDSTKAMSESFGMMQAFYKCGDGGCYFQYELMRVCSAAVDSLSIGPVFLDGNTEPQSLDVPLEFCGRIKKDSINWAMENVCIPETAARKFDTGQPPSLTATFIDGTSASLTPMRGSLTGEYPPVCFETL